MVSSDQLVNQHKWDERFVVLAEHIAQWSKDPSTKVGAVLVDDQRRVVGHGYNGFPRGVADTPERYADREIKYKMVVHAEANAILNAAVATKGCTLYSTFFPCPGCASLLIQSGIVRVISRRSPSDDRWAEQQKISETMFAEAGIRFGTI